MTTITLEEMQRDLQRCMAQVEAGETLVITRGGQPVAEIKPVIESASETAVPGGEGVEKGLRPIGLAEGEFMEAPDFDDPLPEEILRLFEGGAVETKPEAPQERRP
jgi:antitoxin (DNA-binding transcriptional repressor) of toxin-antitoxin stability system